jgi:sugar O-acyltransferase (sialic acid O-acetyltransferase NeuD family)
MRKIAYVGAGRLARQFASYLEPILVRGSFQSLYFGQPAEADDGITVVPFERYLDNEFSGFEFHVALGYRQIARKRAVVGQLRTKGRALPSLIHSTAFVHPSSTLGVGCAIYPGVVIGPNCTVGDGALLNTAVVLAHDVVVGEASYLSPSVTVSGCSRIGAECFLGTGTLVSNDLSIGVRCRLGIGSVVTHSLPDDTQGLGNPFQVRSFELT